MKNRVNYNSIASSYNKRYSSSPMKGIQDALNALIKEHNPKAVLDVGCGTGRWLTEFYNRGIKITGLDYSNGMLTEAAKIKCADLIRADANLVPIKENQFDLIYCVNAVHHFRNDLEFIRDIRKLLRHNGMLAIIGLDHHEEKMDWYIYNYFDGTYEYDKQRFTPFTDMKTAMLDSDFKHITINVIDSVNITRTGNDIFSDPFLEREQSSQLAVLSEEEYALGISKMKNKIEKNPYLEFHVNFSVKMITGQIS